MPRYSANEIRHFSCNIYGKSFFEYFREPLQLRLGLSRPISSRFLSCCLLVVSFHLISPPTLSRRKHHSVPFTFVPLDRRWYRGYLFPRSFLLSSLSRFFTLTGRVATNVHARCPRIQRIALVFHYLRFTVLASNRYDDHGSNNQTRVG